MQTHLLKSDIANVRLRQLTPSDVERYHHAKATSLAPGTLKLHHAILSAALKLAVRDGHVYRSVAPLVRRVRPPARQRLMNAWTAEEARKVLVAAKERDTQTAAFLALAIDSGARKGELQGLRWTDVDLTTGVMRIERQLLKSGLAPVFGPTKTRRLRKLDLSEATLALLREHKREQAELKLSNRPHFADHGLVFSETWEHRRSEGWQLGIPLSVGVVSRMLERLIASTDVRRITVHGLRHTSATLLLSAGVQPHVVQQRLGHSNIGTTLNVYGHVLPSMQQDAAQRLSALLWL